MQSTSPEIRISADGSTPPHIRGMKLHPVSTKKFYCTYGSISGYESSRQEWEYDFKDPIFEPYHSDFGWPEFGKFGKCSELREIIGGVRCRTMFGSDYSPNKIAAGNSCWKLCETLRFSNSYRKTSPIKATHLQ